MGSTPNPGTWILNVKRKDCSQGYCNFHCPKWCYIIFPPPPPSSFVNNHSTTNFSPLVIAIIGILGSAFLLVSYYAIISKYCKNRRNLAQNMELEGNQDPLNRTLWVVSRNGLDESLIKSIAMFKYKKEDGIVLQGTDCSVCLGDFQEDENLKLLPKCSHAFHETCIDPWLKTHSNCPLCRAKVVADDIEIGITLQEIVHPTQEGTSNVVQNSETCSVGSDEEHHVRRSLSMDVPSNVSIVKEDDYRIEEGETSKQDCVTTPTPVTTISIISPVLSGRFALSNCGKARNSTILPL